MNSKIIIVPPIRAGHSDSDFAYEMNSQGNKDFTNGYCCSSSYGLDMFNDEMICYWCAYEDDWEEDETINVDEIKVDCGGVVCYSFKDAERLYEAWSNSSFDYNEWERNEIENKRLSYIS